jgi:predicted nucleotidyltransferase
MKNKFGLLDTDLDAIVSLLSNHTEVERVYIFGSRAKGNFKNGSDVDLALKGDKLDFDTLSKISYFLNEETNMPYKFDVLNYHAVKEPDLLIHIDRISIEILNNVMEVSI